MIAVIDMVASLVTGCRLLGKLSENYLFTVYHPSKTTLALKWRLCCSDSHAQPPSRPGFPRSLVPAWLQFPLPSPSNVVVKWRSQLACHCFHSIRVRWVVRGQSYTRSTRRRPQSRA